MSRVIADILEGQFQSSVKGDSARRVFQVSELGGAAAGRLVQAGLASGIPQKGEAHPARAGIQVLDVTARATNDPTIALVDVNYGVPDADDAARTSGQADVQVTTSLITETTTRDILGNFLRTTWTVRIYSTDAGDPEGTRRVQNATQTGAIHTVEVQVPSYSVRFTRWETRAALAQARIYSGTTNSSAFLDAGQDYWLCSVSSTQQAPNEHRVTYEFTYNRRTWKSIITHEVDGVIPEDLTADGISVQQVYPRANFNRLQLPRL